MSRKKQLANSSYNTNPRLKPAGIPVEFTEEQFKEYIKCVGDPLYFISNYIKIVNVDEGLVNFPIHDRPYQERLIKHFHDNRFSIANCSRQVGKTTCAIGYILWCTLFTPNFSVNVLANKHSTAKMIMERYQLAYEHLPKWIQQGVMSWNTMGIELENGSKVISSSTNSSAGRGGSYNLIYLDEFAHVQNHIAEDFFASIYPTISSGQTTKVMITSTPKGMNHFYKIWHDAENKKNSYKTFTVKWFDVPGRDEKWKESEIANLGEKLFEQEHEVEFLGSSNTLISGKKLRNLVYEAPIHTTEAGFSFYREADRSHPYVIVVDTSEGTGQDYHAFIVFDVSKTPYEVVCVFRNNEISDIILPNYIMQAALHYNNAYILVENNGLGRRVLDILQEDMEYDGLISTAVRTKNLVATGGFGTKSEVGVRTTKSVKRLGCSTFKSMVESDQIIINDFNLYSEMTRFSLNGSTGTYAADTGNDDVVMCGVLFSWLTSQPYFKELTGTDVIDKIYGVGSKTADQMLAPTGFYTNGNEPESELTDGDLWYFS